MPKPGQNGAAAFYSLLQPKAGRLWQATSILDSARFALRKAPLPSISIPAHFRACQVAQWTPKWHNGPPKETCSDSAQKDIPLAALLLFGTIVETSSFWDQACLERPHKRCFGSIPDCAPMKDRLSTNPKSLYRFWVGAVLRFRIVKAAICFHTSPQENEVWHLARLDPIDRIGAH